MKTRLSISSDAVLCSIPCASSNHTHLFASQGETRELTLNKPEVQRTHPIFSHRYCYSGWQPLSSLGVTMCVHNRSHIFFLKKCCLEHSESHDHIQKFSRTARALDLVVVITVHCIDSVFGTRSLPVGPQPRACCKATPSSQLLSSK